MRNKQVNKGHDTVLLGGGHVWDTVALSNCLITALILLHWL